jgi:lipoprotein-releasing system ATP-binding protein
MIQAKNLHKVYNHKFKQLEVLKGVDLSIRKDETLSIVGPSGAGKSTLLHLLAGLDLPTKGSVLINGVDIYSLSYDALAILRNKKIGFVFQFYHLFSEFSALENVFIPALINKKLSQKDAQRKAKDLLDMLGLGKRLDHRPAELSGGEQQRVVIARALVNDPEILFCDEPTGNLDSEAGGEIINILSRLNEEKHTTLVLVTHNEKLAQFCQRRVYLKDGQIN